MNESATLLNLVYSLGCLAASVWLTLRALLFVAWRFFALPLTMTMALIWTAHPELPLPFWPLFLTLFVFINFVMVVSGPSVTGGSND